jgi:hypothetical protein
LALLAVSKSGVSVAIVDAPPLPPLYNRVAPAAPAKDIEPPILKGSERGLEVSVFDA